MKTKSTLVSAIVIIVAIIAIILVLKLPRHAPGTNGTANTVQPQDLTFVYTCAEDKTIKATYHIPGDDYVTLALSDGRTVDLKHVVSESGSRYVSDDKVMAFEDSETGATLQEGAGVTYMACATNYEEGFNALNLEQ